MTLAYKLRSQNIKFWEEINMKKVLLTLYVLFRILLVEGSHLNSELILKTQTGAYFTTALNNSFYNSPVQSLHLTQIEPGRHSLRINEVKFNGRMHNWFEHLIYNGFIDIPAATRVTAVIDSYGRLVITNLIPLIPPVLVTYYNYPSVSYPYGYMVPSAFENLKNIVRNQSFDSSKLKIAKQAIAANNVRTEQVLQLMDLLTFESYKLDLAKFAYQYTVDKQNYFMLYDGFTFQSSINQLAMFIGQGNNLAWQ